MPSTDNAAVISSSAQLVQKAGDEAVSSASAQPATTEGEKMEVSDSE